MYTFLQSKLNKNLKNIITIIHKISQIIFKLRSDSVM